MCRALFALVCAATLLVASDCQQQASDNAAVPIQELPSFSTVQACVPFNILIEPSGTSGGVAYGLQVEAEPQVASAIKATVGGDTLRLETGSFITRQPIKVRGIASNKGHHPLRHPASCRHRFIFQSDSFRHR
jgi:nitrous oxide reductase accessory protein NosL